MTTPLVHDSLEPTLATLKSSLPQSLLLSGPTGVGLLTIARYLCDDAPAILLRPTDSKGHIDDRVGAIKVEAVRDLYDQLRTTSPRRRVVIIDNADRMNHAAQNAFLKLLEEPNDSVAFILTTHLDTALLPTVLSRVQHVHVPQVEGEKTSALISSTASVTAASAAKLQFIASGLPAELHRLLDDPAHFERRVAVMTDAKQFIESSNYDRIVIAHRYASERSRALQLIDGAIQILRHSMSAHPDRATVDRLEQLTRAHQSISANGNIRLHLLRSVL